MADGKELISIVVPVYNLEPFLPRCLDSLLSQTHQTLEILAVNDGSTDASGAILDAYAKRDSRVRVLHKENGGVSAARNAALDRTQGAYIGFADGDDELEPTMYERLLGNLRTHRADIAHCGHRLIGPDGGEKLFYGTGRLVEQDRHEGIAALLRGDMIEPGCCTKLYRAALFDGVRFDSDIRINEDLLINYRLFRRAQTAVFEDICPYHYLKRAGSASMQPLSEHHVRDPLTVKKLILADCIGTPEEPDARRALLNTYLHMYNNLLMTDRQAFLPEKREVRETIRARRGDAALLGRKQRLFAGMILHAPWLYKPVYRLYRR